MKQCSMGSVDIGFLTETERDMIIEVLKRDEKLRTCEKKRVIQLKCELRDIRRKGAKKAELTYGSHVCARCNASTGYILNKAHSCSICKHKTCENCRVISKDVRICVVCYKESKIKAKTGEWFFDAMRAELKPMADGSTLLKQAVMVNTCSQPSTPVDSVVSMPEIRCIPASGSESSSHSSFVRSPDLTSMGSMESLPSSSESHSFSSLKYARSGPAETGSIESLRSLRYIKDYYSDSDQSSASFPTSPIKLYGRQGTTLPPANRLPAQLDRESSPRATMPRIKPPIRGYSHSPETLSLDQLSTSTKSTFERDTVNNNETLQRNLRVTSSAMKKLHSAGKKLQVQKVLSRSVPSLAMPPKKSVANEESEPMSVPDYNSSGLTVPRVQQLSLSTSNIAESTISEDISLAKGEIKFSLEFDYKKDHLLVFIAECRNLSCHDYHRKSCDPYVKCYLLPDRSVKRKTSSKKHTRSPQFNQVLKFPVSMSELGNRILEMSVWNSATFSRNSFLGHLQITLDSWKWQSSPTPHWYPLKRKELTRSSSTQSDTYRGDLLISVSYKSPEKCLNKHGEIHVMIKQAVNLMPMLSNGTVDAFAKVSVLPEKDVQEKTSAIGGGVSPIWNAKFRLPLLHRPIEASGMQITLWHKPHGHAAPRKSRRFLLGGTRLALAGFKDNQVMSTTEEERLVWEKICYSGGNWVDATLSLRSLS